MTSSVVAETEISRNGIEEYRERRAPRRHLLRNGYRRKRPYIATAKTMIVVKKPTGALIVDLSIKYMIHVTHGRCEVYSKPATVHPVRRLKIKTEIIIQTVFENNRLLPFASITGRVADIFPCKAQYQIPDGLFLLIDNAKIPRPGLLPPGGCQLCDQPAKVCLTVGAAACEA